MASLTTSSGKSSDSHIDRKSLKQPDSFEGTTRGMFTNLSKHKTGMAIALVGIIVLLGILAVVMNRQETKNDAAKSALYLAQKSYGTELKAIMPAPPTPAKAADGKAPPAPPAPAPEAAQFLKVDVDAKFSASVKKLQDVDANFGSTRAAHEARLMLGDIYMKHGEPAKALPWLQKAVDSAPGTFEKALALTSVGYANENAGKNADAIQSFEKALNLGEASLKGDLLLAVARNHEALKDNTKAKATYDQIISQLAGSEHAKTAEQYKAQLE